MPKLPIKKKLDSDPEKKPQTAGNWEGFARNIAAGMNQTQTGRQQRYAGMANLYGNAQWYGGLPLG